MRKTIAAFLSVLLLFASLSAFAETYTSEFLGLLFEVPSGFVVQETVDEENLRFGLLISAGDGSVHYIIAAAVLQEMEGVNLDNITEAQIIFLGDYLMEDVPYDYELDEEDYFLYFEADDGTQFIMAEVDEDGLIYTYALISGTGEELTDDQYDDFFDFFDTIDFDE